MNLSGVFPPVPTPFRDDQVDLDALGSNIDRWMQTRLAGIVALGSNGEAPLVDDVEADRIAARARRHVPANRLLIIGTGRESTAATIAATQRAADAGADAVLVRTPSFFKAQITPDVLVRHYSAVADLSPVPVVLYNFTAITGVNLLPSTVAALATHENIVGVKESGGDLAQIADLVTQTPEGFSVVVGSATTFYASLCVGVVGGILALASIAPSHCVRLFELGRQGPHAEALALQRRLVPLARLVTSQYGIAGLKAAMDLVGFIGGAPRAPLRPLDAAAVESIRRELARLEAVEM